jgi:hypothetical protein
VITVDGSRAEVEVVGTVAYVKGDTAMLARLLKVPASAVAPVANRWVAFPATDREYAILARGVTLSSVLRNTLPSVPLSQHSSTRFDGARQVMIDGSAPATFGPGKASLLVSLGSPPLPVSLSAADGSGSTLHVDFLRWGVPASLRTPPGASPASSAGL